MEVLLDLVVEITQPVLKKAYEKLAQAPNTLPVFEELDTIATPKLDVKPGTVTMFLKGYPLEAKTAPKN